MLNTSVSSRRAGITGKVKLRGGEIAQRFGGHIAFTELSVVPNRLHLHLHTSSPSGFHRPSLSCAHNCWPRFASALGVSWHLLHTEQTGKKGA